MGNHDSYSDLPKAGRGATARGLTERPGAPDCGLVIAHLESSLLS